MLVAVLAAGIPLLGATIGFSAPSQGRARARYTDAAKRWHAVAEAEKAVADETGRPMLVLHSLNTDERVALPARGDDGGFDARALDRAAHLLRDQRTGKEHPVHPGLLDLLYRAQRTFDAPLVRVISGYRAPGQKDRGTSNHGRGRAMDVVLPGVPDDKLAEWARSQAFVGVGIYPIGKFCHLDLRPQSYYWRDASPPGGRSREMRLRGNGAQTADAAARSSGKTPLPPHAVPAPRVAAAFRSGLGADAAPAKLEPEAPEEH